jgi:hypothetical protein
MHYSDYIYFIITLTLPLVIGIYLIIRFWKNEIAKFVGLLISKPVISVLLLLVESSYDLLDRLGAFYSYIVVRSILWIVPELILTLIVVYYFRALLVNNTLVRSLLILDTVRWFSAFILLLLPDPFPEPYFYWQLYFLVFIVSILPSLYAIGGLIVMNRWIKAKTLLINQKLDIAQTRSGFLSKKDS